MKRLIGTLALATALASTGALAENTVAEHRAKLEKLWSQETASETRPVAMAVQQDFAGTSERRNEFSGAWQKNWRGGRKFPPAGR